MDDVLEVQAEVARAVAREVQVKLSPHDARRLHPEKKRSTRPQAYEAYLRGRHFWYRRTEEGMRKSIECFQEAMQYDPSFAGAYDGISEAHTMLACRGITPALDSFHKAKAAARQAVRIEPVEHSLVLDPLNSVINASVGMIRYLAHDYDGALIALRRGLEIDPTH